jgi:hypothetical protein
MKLRLVRHAYLPDVTLGKLHAGTATFRTLEEPWIPNPRGPGGMRRSDGRESCVPDGEYMLHPHSSAKYTDVWRLFSPSLGVFDMPGDLKDPSWGRAAILIHSGNTTANIEGCILVGMRHGTLDGMPAVLDSRVALDALRTILAGEHHHDLVIRPSYGTEE